MHNFRQLNVWQKGMSLVETIYLQTKQFPDEEKYGLVSQMRRAAVSIPSNIAEGHVQLTSKHFKRYIAIARGSCTELETQNLLALRLGYIQLGVFNDLEAKIVELSKMLNAFHTKL